jgi:hypothetical protein
VTQVSEGDSEYIDFLMKQFQSNDIETLAKRIMKYYKDVICQNRQLIKFSYNHTFGFGFH